MFRTNTKQSSGASYGASRPHTPRTGGGYVRSGSTNRSAGSSTSGAPRTRSGYGSRVSGSGSGAIIRTSGGYGNRSGGSYAGRTSSSSASRPSFNRGGSSRPPFRGGRSGGGAPRRGGGRLDISKFINKAVITEEVDKFVPEKLFKDFEIDNRLKKNILDKGYETPTPIQDRVVPHILRGEDVVGIANTGTGKTAAFLLPLINKVLLNPKQRVLILAPTRELAIQIQEEFKTFSKGLNMYSVCCVGGMSIGLQMRDLKYYNQFIIGTPGRLKDLIERKRLDLSTFNTVVLDEADRMLDMGFINDMRYVMSLMPKERHTLFFSATLSADIEKVINDFLKTPVRISVKTRDTAKNVDQDVIRTKGGVKIDILHDLLIRPEFKKVLIFGRTKRGVERLAGLLVEKGFKVDSIHGDKTHSNRQRALKLFKEDRIQTLIATDVAARGLDIPDVSHVINYDLPETYEDYVHRIGRTGRANKKGKALTFVD